MLSFVGRGMCTSVSADQRSEALGARNAGECRLAQDGLEHDEAGAGVDERQEEQGDEEESGKRAADHFEEPGPLVVERVGCLAKSKVASVARAQIGAQSPT